MNKSYLSESQLDTRLYGDIPLRRLPLNTSQQEILKVIKNINNKLIAESKEILFKETITGLLSFNPILLGEENEIDISQQIKELQSNIPTLIKKMELFQLITLLINYNDLFIAFAKNLTTILLFFDSKCEVNSTTSKLRESEKKTISVSRSHQYKNRLNISNEYNKIPLRYLEIPKKYTLLFLINDGCFKEKSLKDLTVEDIFSIETQNLIFDIDNNSTNNDLALLRDLLIEDLQSSLPLIIDKNKANLVMITELKNDLINLRKSQSEFQFNSFLRSFKTVVKCTTQENFLESYKFPDLRNLYLNSLKLPQKLCQSMQDLNISYNENIITILIKLNTLNKSSQMYLAKDVSDFLYGLIYSFAENGCQNDMLITTEQFYNYSHIDKLLLKCLDEYFMGQTTKNRNISMSLFSYNSLKKNKSSLCEEYQITRQHAYILRKKIKNEIREKIGVDILEFIKKDFDSNYITLGYRLKLLARSFEDSETFFDFLKIIFNSSRELNSIETAYKNLCRYKKNIFDSFFSTISSPVSEQSLIDFLQSHFGFDKLLSKMLLDNYIMRNYLQRNDYGYIPRDLSAKEAIAHTLTFFPEGLPWKDVARITNMNNYSSAYINEEKSTCHHFSDSDLVYVSSNGVYKNIMYFHHNIEVIESNLLKIKTFLEAQTFKTLHLKDYYNLNQEIKGNINYFDLRHMIRKYGETYGIFFNGKSGVERIGLNSQLESLSQEDVILRALNQSKSGMTRQEVSELIKSKSASHAASYLHRLISMGKVVRIDMAMYSTPEKAFENIDTNRILSIVSDIIESTNKIIEVDIFRAEINLKMNLSYSKYFYSSLIKLNLDKLHLYNQNHLFSTEPIPFKSLKEILSQQCSSELSFEENFLKLQEVLLLTRDVAYTSIVVNGVHNGI